MHPTTVRWSIIQMFVLLRCFLVFVSFFKKIIYFLISKMETQMEKGLHLLIYSKMLMVTEYGACSTQEPIINPHVTQVVRTQLGSSPTVTHRRNCQEGGIRTRTIQMQVLGMRCRHLNRQPYC